MSGAPGVKYDLVEVADVDKDGDLDILTCEESTNDLRHAVAIEIADPQALRRPGV